MTGSLIRKLLRDVRLPLLVVMLLLIVFEALWVKITQRITGELAPFFRGLVIAQGLGPTALDDILFRGPGKIVQTLMGGENIKFYHAMDMLTIGYVHPLVQVLFCIWAIGRCSGAIAGEIDRGTMELLLAQPVPRYRVVLAHLCVDLVTIPLLCLSLWAGTSLGKWLVGPIEIQHQPGTELPVLQRADPEKLRQVEAEATRVDLSAFGPSLWNVAALIFAVSGYTMWLSAAGRSRWRVLGLAVFLTLVQFLVNILGQLWDALAPLRPFTVFFYYQPQQIVLHDVWSVDLGLVWNGGGPLLALNVLAVLGTVGVIGYAMAFWTFCRRDLPAPL